MATIERLGDDFLKFYRVLASLYQRSARGTAPEFIADYLDRGKPEPVVKLGRQNRLKAEIPGVIRPDLILTDDGLVAVELDSVPGGMGFVGAMAQAYCELGFETVGDTFGMPDGLGAMLASVSGVDRPKTAFVVSEESKAYRPEIGWMANAITERGKGDAFVCRPEDIVFTEEALFVRLPDGPRRENRCSLSQLRDVRSAQHSKNDLLLYAVRHNRVRMTPPPKAHLEEKSSFALLHNPALADIWQRELGETFRSA